MIILTAAVFVFTLIALVCDVRTRRLPNWLTVSGLAAGLGFHLVTGGWQGLLVSAGGFATGFGILLVLWLMGGSGAGDVKLMGALGAWLGALTTVYVFMASVLFVGVLAMGTMIVQTCRRGFGYVQRRYLKSSSAASAKRGAQGRKQRMGRQAQRGVLPYGVPVAVATWVVLAWKVVLTQI